MYTLLKTIALSKSVGSQWEYIESKNISLYSLFENYSGLYFQLTNDIMPGDIFFNAYDLYNELCVLNIDIVKWLSQLGNRAVPTTTILPNFDIKYAKYTDAFRSEYKVKLYNYGKPTPLGYSRNDLIDALITRPKYSTDLTLLDSHCLLSVNGFYHNTKIDTTGVCIENAGKSAFISKQNQVGVLSFMGIGGLKKIKLEANDIKPFEQNGKLIDKIFFSINENIGNRSFLLVLGGYMVYPDARYFKQISDNAFMLDLNQIKYLERLLESKNFIDLSSINIFKDKLIDSDLAKTDDVIRQYMTLSQSFLVLVETPKLAFNKIQIKKSNLPGLFHCYQDPIYPLMVGYGRMVEYWKVSNDRFYSVHVADNLMRDYLLSDNLRGDFNLANSNVNLNHKFKHTNGEFLIISTAG